MIRNERCIIYGRGGGTGYLVVHLINHLDDAGVSASSEQTEAHYDNLAAALSAAYATYANKVILVLEDGYYYWLGTDPMPDERRMVDWPYRPKRKRG